MNESTQENFREIYDRLRETEAQTREQNERLSSLIDRIDSFTLVTDKFFELEDKRHQADDARFASLVDHEKRLSDTAEKRYTELIDLQKTREEKFWKVITVLIGAVVVTAMGPKLAKDAFNAFTGKKGDPIGQYEYYPCPMLPMTEHHWLYKTGGNEAKTV